MPKIAKPAAPAEPPIDYVQLAKDWGLDRLNYSFQEMCGHLACGPSYGWEIIREGLIEHERVDGRVLVRAASIAKYLTERRGERRERTRKSHARRSSGAPK